MHLTNISLKKRSPLPVVGLLVALCFLGTAIGLAQSGGSTDAQQGGERQTLRALLDEVHQLRLALQRTNLSTARVQLAFERIRLQMGRVDALSREVESTRAQLAGLRDFRSQAAERVKIWEEQMGRETDAGHRAQIERQLSLNKQNLAAQVQREEQLRDREVQLGAQLQVEQSKLSDLEGQLGNLEREMSVQ